MLLLCCILYIETPDISSPSVSTGVLASRSLALDNVETCIYSLQCSRALHLKQLSDFSLLIKWDPTHHQIFKNLSRLLWWRMTDKFGCGDYSHYMYVTNQDHSEEKKRSWRGMSQILNENLGLMTALFSDSLYRISFYSWLLKIMGPELSQ